MKLDIFIDDIMSKRPLYIELRDLLIKCGYSKNPTAPHDEILSKAYELGEITIYVNIIQETIDYSSVIIDMYIIKGFKMEKSKPASLILCNFKDLDEVLDYINEYVNSHICNMDGI